MNTAPGPGKFDVLIPLIEEHGVKHKLRMRCSTNIIFDAARFLRDHGFVEVMLKESYDLAGNDQFYLEVL